MSNERPLEEALRALGPVTARLAEPITLGGPRETNVLTVGPLEGGPDGLVGVLGAVLTVDGLAPATRVVLRWRVAAPATNEERAARTVVARLEGHGPSRLLAALDTDQLPPGVSRSYNLTAQLEGGVLVGRVAAAMARAGTTSARPATSAPTPGDTDVGPPAGPEKGPA